MVTSQDVNKSLLTDVSDYFIKFHGLLTFCICRWSIWVYCILHSRGRRSTASHSLCHTTQQQEEKCFSANAAENWKQNRHIYSCRGKNKSIQKSTFHWSFTSSKV